MASSDTSVESVLANNLYIGILIKLKCFTDSYYFDNLKNNYYTLIIILTITYKFFSIMSLITVEMGQKNYLTDQSLENDIKSEANDQ